MCSRDKCVNRRIANMHSPRGEPLSIAMVGSRGIPVTYSGVETALAEICPRLVSRGHRVVVYSKTQTGWDNEFYEGVRIKQIPAISTKHLETVSRLIGSLGAELLNRSDIVLAELYIDSASLVCSNGHECMWLHSRLKAIMELPRSSLQLLTHSPYEGGGLWSTSSQRTIISLTRESSHPK